MATKPGTTKRPKPILPFVKEGEELRFVERLRRIGKWPLVRNTKREDPRRPILSPYIVLQAAAGDNGSRPLTTDSQVFYNDSIQILDTNGHPVHVPVAGRDYRLTCRITNLGTLGAFGGMAEFHIAPPATMDVLASTSKPLRAAWGYEGFTLKPGETKTVTSRRVWTPGTDEEAMSTVVVHAHDPFNDLISRRFDARNDRHVARLDTIPDYRGVWSGQLKGIASVAGATVNVRLDVTQVYEALTIQIYTDLSDSSISVSPQAIISTSVVRGSVVFPANGVVAVTSHWKLGRAGSNDLNVGLGFPLDFIANGVLHR